VRGLPQLEQQCRVSANWSDQLYWDPGGRYARDLDSRKLDRMNWRHGGTELSLTRPSRVGSVQRR